MSSPVVFEFKVTKDNLLF